jgi:hypothetical protein
LAVSKSYKTPEQIEASIAKEHDRELAACEDLTVAYLRRCEPRWTGRTGKGGAAGAVAPVPCRH